jgi:hypothetical protein
VGEEATADGPPRRRTSWNLKAIVEDVAGRPIGELQDPGKPVHPYLRGKVDGAYTAPRAAPDDPDEYDPIGNLYPPLVGPAGRDYHGPDHEHHAETLERHRPVPLLPGEKARTPGPSHRPERLYLHYLLLHMDRLSDSALRYLRIAVEEELTHRRAPSTPPAPTPTVRAEEVARPELPPAA